MKKHTKGEIKSYFEGYLFLVPWICGFLIFTLWPIVQSFLLAFSSYDIFSDPVFIGFDNFKEMFTEDGKFLNSLWVTFKYVILSVPIKLIAALAIAMILNQKIRGIGVYRTIYYLPSILGASVAMSVTWKMVLGHTGFVNQILSLVGLGPFDFLADPNLSLQTLAMMSAWQFGSAMVIFLSGLKNIPQELYEAASVDGARAWKKFIKITLPMLSPTILFNLIMNMIGSFQVFTESYVITKGGPVDSTYFYVLHLYRTAFENFRMGYASALAWFLTVIIIIVTAITFKASDKLVYYEN